MALRRGYGESAAKVEGYKPNSGPRVFWLVPGQETTLVLLDDKPVEVARHQFYIKGDRTAASMRQTCFGMDPEEYSRPVPRQCAVCNAMLRHNNIGRKGYIYLTVIDERQFSYKGKDYKDMKLLLELDAKEGELLKRKRDALGGLVGARFKVYRSKKHNSPRHGDDWQIADPASPKVDLVRHFWYSPGAKAVLEAKQKQGERCEHADAVSAFVKPYDYDKLMGTYDPAEAEAFVAYIDGGSGGAQHNDGGQSSGRGYNGGGGDTPPPPPSSGSSPDYSTGSVPSGSVPNTPPPPAQSQQTPPPPPASGPTPPPPNAEQQTPPPPPAQTPPPPPAQSQTPPPPPAQTPPPEQPASVGNDYDFEEGWNADEPF